MQATMNDGEEVLKGHVEYFRSSDRKLHKCVNILPLGQSIMKGVCTLLNQFESDRKASRDLKRLQTSWPRLD